MKFNKIQVFGNADINYIIGKRGSLTNEEINQISSTGVTTPSWEADTVFLSTFTSGLDAGDLAGIGKIVGYEILRKDLIDNSFKYISNTNSAYKEVQDYTARGRSDYEYWIFPVFEVDGVISRGTPVVTKNVVPEWDGITLCGLLPTSEENVYMVDPKNIWHFEANAETNSFSVEWGKRFEDTFGRFSKELTDEKDYLRFNVSAYIGDIRNCSEYINDNIYKINRLRNFLKTTDIKLFKDPKGHCVFGDAENFTYTLDNGDERLITTVSFDFRQLSDESQISVYGVEES